MVQRKEASITLSKYRVIEWITRSHPAIIISLYLPVIVTSLYFFFATLQKPIALGALLFFSGIFFWTFCEYLMHRFVFHFITYNPIFERVLYLMHGIHHDYPRDKDRLVLPPLPSILLAIAFFFLFYVILKTLVFGFFPGFIFGYLCYILIHYSIHAFRPPKNIFKFWWRYHAIHHYKYPNRAFGVSSPAWDYVFGTAVPIISLKSK